MVEDSSKGQDKSPDMEGSALGVSETFGQFLKRERSFRGISLEEIAAATRIHINSLHALEEEDRASLPAEVFVRGFIRSYADFIGLDPEATLNRYVQKKGGLEAGSLAAPREAREVLPAESMAEEASLFTPRRVLLVLLIVAACFAAAVWLRGRLRTPVEPGPGPAVEEPASQAEQPALSPRFPEQPSLAPVKEPALSQSPAAAPELPVPPTGTPAGAEEETETTVTAGPAEAPAAASPEPSGSAGEEAVTAAAASGPWVLEASFSELTWVRVQIDAERPQDFTFRPGQKETWEASDTIDLYVGNAGGIELTLNGKHLGALGKSGRVARYSTPARAPAEP